MISAYAQTAISLGDRVNRDRARWCRNAQACGGRERARSSGDEPGGATRAAGTLMARIGDMTKSLAIGITRGAAIILLDLYRAVLSPLLTAWMGPACRFEPTCSAYAREAICQHGIVAGGCLALRRLARCRPAGGWGYDPVPQDRAARA